jgi:Alcohol dehydrogenase GroES-like domain
MKAIQAAERGGYEALRLVDISQPQPQAGQALVRVTSAGVTPLDRTVLAGLHPRAAAPPLVPGNEGAGVVIEDPSGRFSAGERVLFFAGPGGVTQDGTFAEMASVPSGNLALLPAEIPDEIAAGLPVAYLSSERRSWCPRLEARRRRPLPRPMADYRARSTWSTSSGKASPPGWPGSLLVASTSSLMRSGGPSRARRWAGWRAVAGWW